MTPIETFNELVQGLGQEIGNPDLTPSENGVYSFTCNDQLTIHLEADEKNACAYLFSKIGESPLDDREQTTALNKALLEANLCGIGTHGCNLGVDPNTGEIYLSRLLYLENLPLKQFLYEFEVFLEATNAWLQYLANGFPNLQNSIEIQPLSMQNT